MSQRPVDDENIPPWRETPLDHWSTDIDPTIMAGDEWVDNSADSDPGSRRIAQEQGGTRVYERFMHPTIDTNYGLDDDVFTSEGEE
ncbi:DUF3905 domain-containing protein [Alicyclobacillus tolerans]|uniref:DUF3905 domain-containing protein n=1 Tax=Alicyclobacillus tolerans TaxID=90970 RepID=UPI001F308157|nr:DUF3905 domain-containing protein [Alicyclobacillus tolerans]MCF8564969.1 DUF3905 domain-containing protein [Alicyclobacillus tolerans]